MRKLFILLSALFLLLLAMGCGTETAVPTQPDTTTENETDVQTVAARPQLIEFYADW
jgi:PBP1b-binding outer membrane lipoprotein LpoB